MSGLAVEGPGSRSSVDAPALRGCVEPIDAALLHHVSQRYWNWRTLYERDESACPLQHPDVVLIELQSLPVASLPPVLLTAIDDEGACHGAGALLPKTVSLQRLGGLPHSGRLQGYRLAGNAFLQASSDVDPIPQLLKTAWQQVLRSDAAFLLIEDLDEQSPLSTALCAGLPGGWRAFHHAGIQPRRRIQLPATPEDYWQKFSSKTRQTFRRKLKKFGETRLERITSVADVPRFLELAHAISLHTWQTRQFGLRVRNDSADLALFSKLAELDLLRSYLWYVADQPVAFTIGNQGHGCFHYEEVGYLPEFARHSPGQMMLIQMIDDLIQHDPAAWFDFGGGDADYKELFANHTSRSGTVWLFPPTWSGCLHASHLKSCRSVRRLTRSLIGQLGWTSRFRQWVRYGGGTSRPPTTEPQS